MAHYGIGEFWGYREVLLAAPFRQQLKLPAAMPRMPQMRVIEVESLKTPTYDTETFSGWAADAYPDELVQVGWDTRMLAITISGGFLDIQYSFDGVTVGSEETLRRSHRLLKAISAFRVRNNTAGARTWYQILCMR